MCDASGDFSQAVRCHREHAQSANFFLYIFLSKLCTICDTLTTQTKRRYLSALLVCRFRRSPYQVQDHVACMVNHYMSVVFIQGWLGALNSDIVGFFSSVCDMRRAIKITGGTRLLWVGFVRGDLFCGTRFSLFIVEGPCAESHCTYHVCRDIC